VVDRDLLPTFIVIGAMKSGTSSLSNYLRQHPQVFVTRPKEPNYFSRDFERGVDWYQSHFARAGSATERGEASTTYTYMPAFEGVASRIHDLVPDVKLVYLVRNPIERLRSHYSYNVVGGWEREPFVDAVHEGSHYVDCSRYAYQLVPYLELFSRDQLLVITSRELRMHRAETVQRVCKFIGVDPELPLTGLADEYNVTDGLRAKRPWAEVVRERAGRTPLQYLPGRLKRLLYRPTLRKIPVPDTTMPDDLARRLWDLFAAYLEEVGKIIYFQLDLGDRP
jgi:hypothetical protein